MQAPDSPTGGATESSFSASLEAVFDEHAELRDVVVQLRETSDVGVLAGLVERLHDLLRGHFEREECDQGMLRMMSEANPEHRRTANELVSEHPEILAAVRTLFERARSENGLTADTVEREIDAILQRLAAQ